MLFGELTYEEIKQAANESYVVIIPTGCIEQQGPHLPVDFDVWFASQLCISAAGRAKKEYGISTLVMPTLPFGPTPEHRGFKAGYVHLPQKLHEDVIGAVIQSLLDQGFQKILVWRGCGQHDLSNTVERFVSGNAGSTRIWQPELPFSDIWDRIGDPVIRGGHADAFSTSIALHLRTEAVREELIRDPNNLEPDWNDPDLDFSEYTYTGVIGDPTPASGQLGARLWAAVVDEVAHMIKRLAMEEEENS